MGILTGNRVAKWDQAYVLWGWGRIAIALGVSRMTAQKYAREYGLPVARLAGHVVSSRGLIDLWILELAAHPQGGTARMKRMTGDGG